LRCVSAVRRSLRARNGDQCPGRAGCGVCTLPPRPEFVAELYGLFATFVGRPTPLYRAERLGELYGIARLYSSVRISATPGPQDQQCSRTGAPRQRMGKRRIIAETGAGQHGVATATAAALFGMQCCVYMGRTDMHRQRLNVIRMKMLGAEVRPVDAGRTLKHATSEAIRDWVTTVTETTTSSAQPLARRRIRRSSRPPIGHRARGARTDSRHRRPAPRGHRGVCGWRLERDRHLSRIPR